MTVHRRGVVAAVASAALAATVAPAAHAAGPDTTAPAVTVTVTPARIDVTTGERQVQVTATGTDETALRNLTVAMDETGYYDNTWHGGVLPAGVTTTTRTWTYTVPPGARAGTWTVRASARDTAGNHAESTATFDVAAGPRDRDAPAATCTSTPTTVDTTWAPAPVRASVTLTDPAGVVPSQPTAPFTRWDGTSDATWPPPIGPTFTATASGPLPQGAPIGANRLAFTRADRLDNQAPGSCLLATNTGSRISGADRYATAATAARLEATTGGTVYVVNGASFADAAAAATAPDATAGLLYTAATALPAPTRAALTRLRPARIVVVGSTSAVAPAVEAALRGYARTVVRRGGADPYATSAAVATLNPRGGTAYLVTGRAYPDLVAVAANRPSGSAVLLADPARLGTATASALTRLAAARVVLVGPGWAPGYAAAVARAAAAPVSALVAPDRYALAARLYPATPLPLAFVASGEGWTDTLAVASHRHGRTVYLSTPTALPAPTLAALRADGRTTGILAVGGPAAVADAVQRAAVENG